MEGLPLPLAPLYAILIVGMLLIANEGLPLLLQFCCPWPLHFDVDAASLLQLLDGVICPGSTLSPVLLNSI